MIIVIKEHYNIGKESPRPTQVIRHMGQYLEDKGLLSFNAEYIWERRKDLQGYEFTAETLGHPPYTLCEVTANGRIDHIEGIVGDLWHGILEKSLNFTTKLSLPQIVIGEILKKMDLGQVWLVD